MREPPDDNHSQDPDLRVPVPAIAVAVTSRSIDIRAAPKRSEYFVVQIHDPNHLLLSSSDTRSLSSAAPPDPDIRLLFSMARLPRKGITSDTFP